MLGGAVGKTGGAAGTGMGRGIAGGGTGRGGKGGEDGKVVGMGMGVAEPSIDSLSGEGSRDGGLDDDTEEEDDDEGGEYALAESHGVGESALSVGGKRRL